MGIFSGLLGNASQMDLEKATDKLEGFLIPEESIELAYQLVRDYVVFTSHRLIIVDLQGVGKKQEFQSIPYNSISRFSVELAGNFDLDSELELYISSATQPVVSMTFRGRDTITSVQRALATAILK